MTCLQGGTTKRSREFSAQKMIYQKEQWVQSRDAKHTSREKGEVR